MKVKIERYKNKDKLRMRKFIEAGKLVAFFIGYGHWVLWVWSSIEVYNNWPKQS